MCGFWFGMCDLQKDVLQRSVATILCPVEAACSPSDRLLAPTQECQFSLNTVQLWGWMETFWRLLRSWLDPLREIGCAFLQCSSFTAWS